MSTLHTLTRTAVDAAEPLQFPSRRTTTVHLAYKGVAVDVQLADANVAEVERLVSSLLERTGWAAAAVSPAADKPKAPRAPQPEPWYNDAGEPCCPWHKRPLREGRYGHYCPSRAEGDQANDKGYCRYTLKD